MYSIQRVRQCEQVGCVVVGESYHSFVVQLGMTLDGRVGMDDDMVKDIMYQMWKVLKGIHRVRVVK